NFGAVSPGAIYRAQFPQPDNYAWLSTLGLKAILTLVEGPFDDHYREWMFQEGIQHHNIILPTNKDAVNMREADIKAALSVLLDQRNYPLLIHCNKGKHRTGCLVGTLRLAMGEEMGPVVEEYRAYAGKKARPGDEKFLGEMD
ncbi:protein-tyrosine phosphatase, partial [Microthyrium microscopicum]